MKRTFFAWFIALAMMLVATSGRAFAHCEIPCGIYDDEMRFEMILEHIATIEKSMKAITSLSPPKEGDYNQLVRWVSNKEEHADKIQEIATQYFLAQRVKIPQEKKMMGDYVESLKRLHELVVYAMKAKQSTDIKYVKALRETTESYQKLYRKLQGH
jgi:nickel superoxide dismutase